MNPAPADLLHRWRRWARELRTPKTAMTHGQALMLYRGSELLGRIVLRAELCDFPWYGGAFEAEPAFAPLQPLFLEELRLLGEEEMDAWGEVWRRIDRPALRLEVAGGGAPVVDLLIHIENGVSRWRG